MVRLSVVVVLLISLVACATAPPSTGRVKLVTVGDLVTVVSKALADSKDVLAENHVEPATATLTLQTQTGVDDTLKASVFVVSAEADRSTQKSGELTISLKAPGITPVGSSADDDYKSLVEAIKYAAAAATAARRLTSAQLPFESVAIKIGFTVTEKATGGIVIKVLGSSLSGGPQIAQTNANGHSISVILRKVG
jgi:hypothetical protein